ncbi:MAG: hypothetical protein RTU63_09585 [Candidatus Thorarchaeota archaeon]
MDESPSKKGFSDKHKKLIAIFTVLIIGPPLVVNVINNANRMYLENNPELDPFYEPEYSLTIWIAPETEEFYLHLDFYGSEQDAYSKANRFEGHGIPVRPLDDEENNSHLWAVPVDIVSLWVKIYFNQETEEPFVILRIDFHQMKTTTLQGREISILIEPLIEQTG